MAHSGSLWIGSALLFAAAGLVIPSSTIPIHAQETPDGAESRTYEAVKLRDMLTFDFALAHPDGADPQGVTPEEAAEIEATVKGGAEYLLATQDAEGVMNCHGASYVCGSHSLSLWTVLSCGKPTTDPKVEKAIAAMLRLAEKRPAYQKARESDPSPESIKDGVEGLRTYEASLVLITLHALATARAAEVETAAAEEAAKKGKPIEKKVEPITSRSADDVKRAAFELQKSLNALEIRIGKALFATLVKRQAADGQWSYTDAESKTGDSSNTHFALLGLLSAHRLALGTPPKFQLERTEKYLFAAQQPTGPEVTLTFRNPLGDGPVKATRTSSPRKPRQVKANARGWKYVIGAIHSAKTGLEDDTTLSMSSAAMVCLSILRYFKVSGAGTAVGQKAVERIDQSIHDGLAWMATTLGDPPPQAKNGDHTARINERRYPGVGGHAAYAMLAVERAGILTGCDFFGKCEWYPEGARTLLGRLAGVRRAIPEEAMKETDDKRPMTLEGVRIDSNLCMNLLFLKGYLDKSPKKKPGPTITGKNRPPAPSGD